MYTDCPACNRQFHIYATQLSGAGGEVKCGYCGHQFNALQRLYDQPQPRPPVHTVEQVPGTDDEPQFFIPDSSGQAPEPEINAAGTGPPDEFTTFVFSEEMLEDFERKSGLASRLLWVAGIGLLVLIAVLQVLWFNRDEVMSRYPETRDWYRRVCETLECEYIRHRDLSGIVLLNRDVRDHPRYRDALLVNATMSNQSHTLQPFPLVQLNFYDTDGGLIAYRRFSPAEYMDSSIDIKGGMQPEIPVHFVLEVLGAVEGAVSFEFEFL